MTLLVAAVVGAAVCLCCVGCVPDVAPPIASGASSEEQLPPKAELVPSAPGELVSNRQVVPAAQQDEPLPDGHWRKHVLVIDALGKPVGDAQVDLSAGQQTHVLATAFTDGAGNATLLASGDLAFVRAYHQDVGRSLAVDIRPGRSMPTLMLARPAAMSASLLDENQRPLVGRSIQLLDVNDGRFPTACMVAPSTVVTDVSGRVAFEALVGSHVFLGGDIQESVLAKPGVHVASVCYSADAFEVTEEVVVFLDVDESDRDANHEASPQAMPPLWIEVTRSDGSAAPSAGLHWDRPGRTPVQFFADARDGHRFRVPAWDVERKPTRLLVRGENGYAATIAFDEGPLPSSVGVVLQPPGDIEIQVLHRGRRARGVHTQLWSWGKRARADLDAEGIARYTVVHHGLMEVHVMRGPELLTTRQVRVPSGGIGRAIVHVDLSR